MNAFWNQSCCGTWANSVALGPFHMYLCMKAIAEKQYPPDCSIQAMLWGQGVAFGLRLSYRLVCTKGAPQYIRRTECTSQVDPSLNKKTLSVAHRQQ